MTQMTELVNRKLIKTLESAISVPENGKLMENPSEIRHTACVNQVRYSLLDRSIESNGVMELAKNSALQIIAFSPQGPGTGYREIS